MVKSRNLLVLLLAVFLSLGVAGCGANSDQEPVNAPEAGKGAEAANPLSELAAKAKNIEGMSFDMIMKSSDINAEGKGWVQGKCTRMEMTVMGQKTVMIMDEKGDYYSYMPATNMAIKMKSPQESETPIDYSKMYDDPKYKAEVIETAIYDGAACKVVIVMDAQGKEESRMWVREDYGIPVKIESQDGDDKITVEYKNLKVGPQPKDLFALPPGTQVQTIDVPVQ